jgi:hypothetical protein
MAADHDNAFESLTVIRLALGHGESALSSARQYPFVAS